MQCHVSLSKDVQSVMKSCLYLQPDFAGQRPGDRLVHLCTGPVELWVPGPDGDPLEGTTENPAGLPHSLQRPGGE